MIIKVKIKNLNILELGTVVLGISAILYGIGILLFFDRALLLLSNVLFLVGLYILVGLQESIMFFGRKIKGSIALIIGLVFIITGFKFIGACIQIFGIYEFFKVYALKFLGYFEWIPFIGPYIYKLRHSSNLKKSDDASKV